VTDYTDAKAKRLLIEGRVVVFCGENGIAARVQGDHDEYIVVRERDRWRCVCPSRGRCAHIEAVERVTGG
jgi:hypothetical protein